MPFPYPIETADLNGDGKLDLMTPAASGADLTRAVSVLVGNGDGTFQTALSYQAGPDPFFVGAGDFNGDHETDLAIVDHSAGVGILLNTGVVTFSPSAPLLFPRQLVGTVGAAQTVTLTNSGIAALSITSKSVTGPFQLDTSCGGSVAPAASCDFTVSFQPVVAGAASGLISIRDGASSRPQVIELNGTGTVINLSATRLTFPAQKVGTKSAPQTVTVTNMGATVVNVTGVQISGRNIHDYLQKNTCGTQIAAGASCTLTIVFAPTEKGTRVALLNIDDTGGGSPQGALLSGTGD